jgi:hypothetical protein
MIQSDHHEGYIVTILIWLKWPKELSLNPLDPLNSLIREIQARLFVKPLIFPRSRVSSEIQA